MISAVKRGWRPPCSAMKHGAYHYITKDFEYDGLRSARAQRSEKQDLNRRVAALEARWPTRPTGVSWWGRARRPAR